MPKPYLQIFNMYLFPSISIRKLASAKAKARKENIANGSVQPPERAEKSINMYS